MVLTALAPIGGIESALVPLAVTLAGRGHEVIAFTVEPAAGPNQNAEALRRAGIRLLAAPRWQARLARFGMAGRAAWLRWLTALAAPLTLPLAMADAARRRRPLARSLRGAVGRWHGALARRMQFEALLYAGLAQALRLQPADVVHVHGWGCGEDPPGLLPWLRRFGCPVIYTEHNSPDPALHPVIEAAPMNLADVLIAVSQAGRAGLEQVGRAARPIVVIPYSVEPLPAPAQPTAQVEEFVVTAVARLTPQKGHTHLLEAMARLSREAPQARLMLAGEGPLRAALEAQCERLGLNGQARFLGLVPRAKLPDLLAETDVVALPSLWEGLPVALIEAMSAGKPIVASDVGGNPELVAHGVNGLIVPVGDSAALAEALLRLARDPDLRQRMGRASRQRFESGGFSPGAVADQTLRAYQLARELAWQRP
jgi:glycosyltransferase involved in cell wall biosynthesis